MSGFIKKLLFSKNVATSVLGIVLLLSLFLTVNTSLQETTIEEHAAGTSITFSGLKVSGSKLVNQQGQQIILHGVDRSGTEYQCVKNSGIFDGPSDAASVQAMKAWNINAVNIGLNEDCWLGINGVPSTMGGTTYQQAIVAYTKVLENNNIYPTITLFWDAAGTQKALGQSPMPDADHSIAFWQSVANTFKNDPDVMLRLKEEPHPAGNADSTAAWQCWKNGGRSCNEGYTVVGMQSLVNAIRVTGATNVIQVPGIQYANQMDQFLTFKPSDPSNNLMAVVDVYPAGNPCGSVSCYNSEYAPIIAQMPFIAGEMGEDPNSGCPTTAIDQFMDWMDQHNSGYLAWVWDTWGSDCSSLSLISNYNGTPEPTWGVDYKNRLAKLAITTIVPLSPTSAQPTAKLTATPTGKVTPTLTPKPTAKITVSPTTIAILSPTISPSPNEGQTSIDITIFEHGIGDSGDSANPTSTSLSNKNPVDQQIDAEVQIFTITNQLIASGSAALIYDQAVGGYTATNVPISSGFPTGTYLVRYKTDSHLQAFASSTATITAGKENNVSPATLVAGDINNDNVLNILDYNILIGCYADLLPAASCTPTQQIASDLDGDGSVNQFDYNLFLRELTSQ
jgi:endoglucanase